MDGATGNYPEFKGNVATVFSNPLYPGGSGSGHYEGNPQTYMKVGEAMQGGMKNQTKEGQLNWIPAAIAAGGVADESRSGMDQTQPVH